MIFKTRYNIQGTLQDYSIELFLIWYQVVNVPNPCKIPHTLNTSVLK
jgi:hypothetical protein